MSNRLLPYDTIIKAHEGDPMDILPPDLVTFSQDAKNLLNDLQSRNERMFLLTFLVVNTAATRRELDNDLFTVSGIMQKYNCLLKRLDFQQEQGLVSSLPLGYNGIEIQRGMTTSSTAIFVPFMTQELRILWQSGKIAFGFSLMIEMLQLLLRLGTFQLSDIFYNTVGGVLGGLMYYAVMKVRKRL